MEYIMTVKQLEKLPETCMGDIWHNQNIDMLIEDDVISIYQNKNKLNSSLTYGKEYRKIYGDDTPLDYIGDYKFNISPNSFFQVNRIQAEVLYNKAIEYFNQTNTVITQL